jgi:hypothetical protein
MAPEQAAEPAEVGPRADVYGLGCTLYFLLTGRSVFAAGNVAGQLAAHRSQAAPPLGGELARLNPLLSKMLAKRPEDRYESMAAVIEAIERLATRRPIARGRSVIGAVAMAAVLLALGAVAWDRPRVRPEPPRVLDAPFDGRVQQEQWAGHLNLPATAFHSGVRFHLIPPGRCWIGSTQAGVDWMLAREAHPYMRQRIGSEGRRMASVAAPLYMSATEVTVGQFRRFVDATGYRTQVERERRGA